MIRRALPLLLALAVAVPASAQDRPDPPPWTEDAPDRKDPTPGWRPQVDLRFDRYYSLDELYDAVRLVGETFPDFVEVRNLGTSVEGRDLIVAVVSDFSTGDDTEKPAFWCDGNIHGNEVQAGDACLYMLWWLCENRELPRVAKLLRERAFYICPSVNPDGRAHWFDAPNTMHSSRGGKRPVDNDRDGQFDEDGPNDLDGDGELLQMRIEDPAGTHVIDPEEPRLMRRAKSGERGTHRMLGLEGIDDDGDGRINEDGPGGYDPNRDWPSDWGGPADQYGAGPYPASLPETRAVIDFVLAHPNIAGFQSYHNTGGMILRGPGTKEFGGYPSGDERVLRALAARGEAQLPHYRSLVIWKDLYSVHGGEVNFAYEGLGIFAFTNELFTNRLYFGRPPKAGDEGRRERLRFDDEVELGARYVDWKTYEHPQFGTIELGGWRKQTGRVPPPFMLQEELHRNTAFVLFHASEMPLVKGASIATTDLGGGLVQVDATFSNDGMIPTRSAQAREHDIGSPDRVEAFGDAVEVVSGGRVAPRTNRVDTPDVRRPDDLRIQTGIAGDSSITLRFVVRGSGTVNVTYTAEKGGSATLTTDLP